MIMSRQLGEIMGAGIGDEIQVEALEGQRATREVPVRGFLEDFAGVAAYMDIDALRRLMHEGATVSGAHLSGDTTHCSAFMRQVKATPRIATPLVTQAQLESLRTPPGQQLHIIRHIYQPLDLTGDLGYA